MTLKNDDKYSDIRADLGSSTPRARVNRTIRDWIASGQLPPGDAMPTEQSLVEHFSASRSTIRAVLKDLEGEGLIQVANRRRIVATYAAERTSALSDVCIVFGIFPEMKLESLSPGFMEYVQVGVMQEMTRQKINYMAVHPETLTLERMRQIINQRPMGVIGFYDPALPMINFDYLQMLKDARIPTAVYGYESELNDFDTVCSDQEIGNCILTRCLIDKGCRNILRYWESKLNERMDYEWLNMRDRGYERAMSEAGLEPLSEVHIRDVPVYLFTREEFDMKVRYTVAMLQEIFSEQPDIDAIMTISDGLVYPIATACDRLGKKVGRDVLIVGYDNYWNYAFNERKWCPFTPAATIDKCNYDIGVELVRLLQARIQADLDESPQHHFIKPQLVLNDI